MAIIDSIINFRRFLKRRNCAKGTVKNYINSLKNFAIWIDLPIEEVANQHILEYIDHLLDKRLRPKTINNNLDSIRGFYNYLQNEEKAVNINPVKKGYCLRLGRPLPKHLRDEQAQEIFNFIKSIRDRAIFMLMLRCGLRVDEVANLTLSAIDLKRGQILIFKGKGAKGRIVYFSKDTYDALVGYIKRRKPLRTQSLFLVEKGTCKGKAISVRGIQKRIEYYLLIGVLLYLKNARLFYLFCKKVGPAIFHCRALCRQQSTALSYPLASESPLVCLRFTQISLLDRRYRLTQH